jgi:hypothetical protein
MKLIKEIKSRQGVLHFRRWAIFQSKYFSIYKHGIYHEDEDNHLHNHPWNLLTIILDGSYIEELESKKLVTRTFLHFGFRSRKKYHKIQKLLSKEVFTLAFAFGKRDDEWGYKVVDKHIIHTDYRKLKHNEK